MTVVPYVLLGVATVVVLLVAVVGFLFLLQLLLNAHESSQKPSD